MARARALKPAVEDPEHKKPIRVREKGNPVRIRVGPGLGFTNVDGKVLGKGEHQVDEIVSGPGSQTGWAHLSGDGGWVALDFLEKIDDYSK